MVIKIVGCMFWLNRDCVNGWVCDDMIFFLLMCWKFKCDGIKCCERYFWVDVMVCCIEFLFKLNNVDNILFGMFVFSLVRNMFKYVWILCVFDLWSCFWIFK